jgi:hypothetical protein
MNYNTPLQRRNDIQDFDRKKPPLPTYNSERKTTITNDDKFLSKSPKEEYTFQNRLMNRCNSTGKVLLKQYKENINSMNTLVRNDSNNDNRSNAGSRDHSYMTQQNNISKISNSSSVSQYLDKRHQDAQRKINQLRNEKYQKEIGNYGFKPRISEASKKIISKLSTQESPMRIDSNRKEYITNNNVYEPYQEKEKFENLLRNEKTNLNREREHERNRSIEKNSFNSINPDSQRKRNHSISTITRTNSNSKSNVSKKLSKTIEELNDYKKMMEKREIIMLEEKNREIEKERERARALESAGIKRRPLSAVSHQKTDYRNNTTLSNQQQMHIQQNYTPVNTNFKTISNTSNPSNTSTNRHQKIPLALGNTGKLMNDPYSNPQYQTQKNPVMMNTLKLNSERERHADININNNKYYDYNPEKVIDARRGLNEYLIERKEKNNLSNISNVSNLGNNNKSALPTREQNSGFYNMPLNPLNRNNYSNTPIVAKPHLQPQSHVPCFNEENQPKKLFDLKIGNQPNTRELEDFNANKNFQVINKDKIVTGNFSYNNTGNKPGRSNLPSSSIDFNQLDQFSPPNNNNVNVITYEIQKAYQNNLIKEKSGNNNNHNNSSSYNSINQTFGNGPHQRSHSAVPKSREESFSNPNNNKRQEDLDYFKNYIDKIKTQKPKESENTNKDSSPSFNSEKPSQKSVISVNTLNTVNTGNTVKLEKNVTSEIYKLNPSSKNYALEKMLEMKARAGGNFS